MVRRDVEADLREIQRPLPPNPLPPNPVSLDEVKKVLTQSAVLQADGTYFSPIGDQIWEIRDGQQSCQVTFDPKVFEENSSLRLMA